MWRKLGMVFRVKDHNIGWLKSHAMLPSPLVLEDRIRVYFTGRHEDKCSRISFVDLSREDPTQILYVHDKPLLEVGKRGTFDDSGTLGTWALSYNGMVYLYYNGYNLRVLVPWSNAIGLAISRDEGVTFERAYEGPIMDRTRDEPYMAITPCILQDDDVFRMWYTSGTGWTMVDGRAEPLYVIKYAESLDLVSWPRLNVTCIEPHNPNECTARPAVLRDGNKYRMWFIYRGSKDFRDGADSYKIGYAEARSDETWNWKREWKRDDSKAGIACSESGWDSKMLAYPALAEVDDKVYMFYNGNGFGAEGFGCAILEEAK